MECFLVSEKNYRTRRNKMDLPYVSVVIPTFNRGPILRNTLLSLSLQNYPKSRYEIVLVDDGSTDNTNDLLKMITLDNLKVFSKQINQGAGPARNFGIQQSEGELIIFCDSDFVVPSTYLANHVEAHNKDSNLAVSGMGHWHYIFSYDYKDEWFPFQEFYFSEVYNKPIIQQRLKQSNDNFLLNENDIIDGNFEPFLFCPDYLKGWVSMFEQLISSFGPELNNFEYPWLSFCTGNVSLKKDHLTSLGGFDESFLRLEDWELGYRFFLEGGRFCFSPATEAYQQHHPINPERNNLELSMFEQLCTKHPSFDIYLLSLKVHGGLSYKTISQILDQHKKLKWNAPSLHPLIEQFEKAMKAYAFRKRPHFHTGKKKYRQYWKEMKSSNLYSNWIDIYRKLENKNL